MDVERRPGNGRDRRMCEESEGLAQGQPGSPRGRLQPVRNPDEE